MINVEVVDIRKVASEGTLKAFASVKFSDAIIVNGFNVVMGKAGVFVTMPRKASKDGRWLDVLTPVNDEIKKEIEDKVLDAYEKESA